VTGYLASEVGPALADGRLDGAESSAGAILSNNYQSVARHLPTNVVLFLRRTRFAIGRRAFEHLLAPSSRMLCEPRRRRPSPTRCGRPTDAADLEPSLPARAFGSVARRPAELAALRAAEDPVYRMLEGDPATATIVREIERLKSARPADRAAGKCAAQESSRAAARVRPIPEGRYATTLTAGDYRGYAGNVAEQTGTYTTTLRRGRFRQVLTPTRPTQPPGYGTYTVRGDEVTFVFRSPNQMPGVRETVRWSYYRGELTFKIVSVADSAGVVFYTAHPWRRTG